jgi:hypothetical protein
LIINIGEGYGKILALEKMEAIDANTIFPPDWDDYVTEYKQERRAAKLARDRVRWLTKRSTLHT